MGMTGEQAYVLAKKLIEAGGGGGGTVDAYTKTQTDNLLKGKVDKEAGKGLFSGSYNDLSDVPTIPSKTSELQNDSGYLTEHQDLSDYAKKTEIPSLDGYATEQWVGEQGYLTEHQDLSGYTKKTDFDAVSEQVNTNTDNILNIINSLMYHNAGSHNSIYRGKNLGNALTDEQKAQINAGTFEDMYIGDYWEIDGVIWRIAHFDYWIGTGNIDCNKHHIVIVPDTILYNAKMNDTNITTGAYGNSAMHTTNLENAKTIITNAFGSANILNHKEYLANATNGTEDSVYESAGDWYDSTVELMNEHMVYGSNIFHNAQANGAIPSNHTIDKSQLALFRLNPSKICKRESWWMRDVISSECFAFVHIHGNANYTYASNSTGVRPVFGISGD